MAIPLQSLGMQKETFVELAECSIKLCFSNGTGATQGEDVSEAPEEPPSEEANADEEPATPAAPPEVAEEKEEAQPEQTPTPEVAPQPRKK